MGETVIKGGQRWCRDHFIQNQELVYETDGEAAVLELDDEDLITPGLIDFHVHLWSPATISAFGVDSGQMFAQGVVGGVEAGSFGADNWKTADRFWQHASPMKVKSFLSVLPEGLAVFPPVNAPLPEEIDTEAIIGKLNEIRNENLLGIKVQLGWLSYKSPETDRELLRKAREIADRTNTKLMVHMSGTCLEMEEMVSWFQEGDIIPHIYSGFDNTILDRDGNVNAEIAGARQRGILFDVGHAGKHFSWDVFQKAYSQGIGFDTLGGDITALSWKNRDKFKIYDLFHLLSGMLNAGAKKEEVFRALITNPADYMGMEMDLEQQCLVLKKVEGRTALSDGMGREQACAYEYLPQLFMKQNKIIYYKEDM